MSHPPAIVIAGAAGRMGQMLIQTVLAEPACRLAGGIVEPGHAWVGQDLGQAMGGAPLGPRATQDAAAALRRARAVIDFTAPEASVALSQIAAEAGVAHIIGTTGFTQEQIAQLERAGTQVAQVRAGNMSLGVNLLVQLTRQVAAALGQEYDIEIIEAHHRHKVDAPSGTALMLGVAAAQGRGVELAQVREAGRDGITGARAPGAIGFSAIRGGDIVGEHDVMFAGPGERITLRHVASDRSLFAKGALRAALWAVDQAPGCYDMIDVLGLRG